MVTALNAAIETQGSVANALTTSIAYIDGHFLIRYNTDGRTTYSIEILSDATAAESLDSCRIKRRVFGADDPW